VDAARERFRTSPLIARLWPERLIAASLPSFEVQGLINAHSLDTGGVPSSSLERARRLLTRSSLRTAVLWELGSDSDIQRLVLDADPHTLANPLVQYHLGLRLLSERQYAAAVEPLDRAAALAPLRGDAARMRTFALCMSGQTERALPAVCPSVN
jgi:hypothetical protein